MGDVRRHDTGMARRDLSWTVSSADKPSTWCTSKLTADGVFWRANLGCRLTALYIYFGVSARCTSKRELDVGGISPRARGWAAMLIMVDGASVSPEELSMDREPCKAN